MIAELGVFVGLLTVGADAASDSLFSSYWVAHPALL